MQSYAAAVVPASAAVAAAGAGLSSALAAAFAATSSPYGIAAMESAFTAFAVTVGGGMAGYTPAPPPGPVGFSSEFASPHPSSHADAATGIATIIDTWMRSGLATLVVPPNTVVAWM
jgi:hypothetical protein